jgi:hypothetical protein
MIKLAVNQIFMVMKKIIFVTAGLLLFTFSCKDYKNETEIVAK